MKKVHHEQNSPFKNRILNREVPCKTHKSQRQRTKKKIKINNNDPIFIFNFDILFIVDFFFLALILSC